MLFGASTRRLPLRPRCYAARPAFRRRCPSRAQDGYVLLVIMLMLSLFVLALAKALPEWTTQIRRQREQQAIDRARGYRMAIERYFHAYGRYPPSLAILLKQDGHGVRYLREAWDDPLASPSAQAPISSSTSGSSSNGQKVQTFHGWQVLHYGQAVTAEIVDQPPAAAFAKGQKPGISGPDLSRGDGQSGPVSAASSATPGSGSPPSFPGGTSVPGALASGGLPNGMAQSGQQSGLSGLGGAAGQAPGTAAGAPGSGPGAGVGGGPVIGVAPLGSKPAVHAFNGFDQPDRWQFVYNYATDPSLRGAAAAPAAGQTPGGLPSPGSNQSGGSSAGQGSAAAPTQSSSPAASLPGFPQP